MDAMNTVIVKQTTVNGRTVPMVEFNNKRFVPADEDELRRACYEVAPGELVVVDALEDTDGVWIEPTDGSNRRPVCLTQALDK